MSNGTLTALGRYCENILPPVLRSSGNRLVVKFRSDATTNGNGFSANWTSGTSTSWNKPEIFIFMLFEADFYKMM